MSERPTEFRTILELHQNSVALQQLIGAIGSCQFAIVVGELATSPIGYPTSVELAMLLSSFAREAATRNVVITELDSIRTNLSRSQSSVEALFVLKKSQPVLGDLYFYDLIQSKYGYQVAKNLTPTGPVTELLRFSKLDIVSLVIDHSLFHQEVSLRQSATPALQALQIDSGTTPKYQADSRTLFLLRGWPELRDKCLISDQTRDGFSWMQALVSPDEATMPSDLEAALLGKALFFVGLPTDQIGALSVLCRDRQEISYALLPDPGTNSRPRISAQLSQSRVRPIWYPANNPTALHALLKYIGDEALLAPSLHWFTESSIQTLPLDELASVVARDRLPPLQVPHALVEQCQSGKCVLLAGSGLSARSGLPTWGQSIGQLIDFAHRNKVISDEHALDYREALTHDRNVAADNVYSDMSRHRDLLITFVREELAKDAPPSTAHETLAKIPFSSVMTSNLDSLIERSFPWPAVDSLTPHDAERLLEALSSERKFIVKLYGDWKRPETVILSPAEYKSVISRNIQFTRFMEGIFFSRTLFFAGVSLEGLSDFLESFPLRSENPRRHYALVAVEGAAWRAKAQALERRYNIEVLPYDPANNHAAMEQFLVSFAAATQDSRTSTPNGMSHASRLTKVALKNIGPFEHLEIEFTKSWKVLLGDNGVGKSTILKAIAAAIVGSDSSSYAGRLIRTGESMGTVTLYTDKNPSGYLTEIFRKEGSNAEVVSKPARPLEAEGWVAIAFPPLRNVTWNSQSGPQAITKGHAVPEDLLPLIRGEVDPRMDKMKQWIINLDYDDKQRRSKGESSTRSSLILAKFFEIVNQITTGLEITSYEVNSKFEVLVKTPDGQIPIEALSQGMTSLYSWVGILVQRMFEIHEDAADPSSMHGIVLMDEIDAHMHPLWQSTLVKKLRRLFPNVQMLVSTHSPLIVGGLETSEIERYERGPDGRVRASQIKECMTQGRADQVLTSELFGLPTTTAVTPEMEEKIREYKQLLGSRHRTPDENKRFLQLV
jgi:energy-coupling factor transporter ATP-binding protein EcfA2